MKVKYFYSSYPVTNEAVYRLIMPQNIMNNKFKKIKNIAIAKLKDMV